MVVQQYWIARAQQLGTLVLLLVLAALAVDNVGAQSANLGGSWSGGGSVTLASGEREALEKLVREQMASAADLSVPLDVSVGIGRTWHEAGH